MSSVLIAAVAGALALAPAAANAAACYSAGFDRSQFPNCQELSSKFVVHWSVASDNSSVTLGVVADTLGFAALGFSESGGMAGANIYALEKNSSSTYALKNYYATKPETPTAGVKQDARLISAQTTNGTLAATFIKSVNGSCDYNDLRIQSGYATPVIWALGSSDAISYHDPANRGDSQIRFIAPQAAPATDDGEVTSLELKMVNYTIPSRVTSYMCTYHRLPNATKYHVIRSEPIIDQKKYLHHMILYGCTDDFDQSKIGTVEDCASMNPSCTTFMIAWAPGGALVNYPREAGFPIGTGVNAIKYFALQVHYNNVDNDVGKLDNSGMRLGYTSKLRANDLGVLTLGTTGINIPPRTANFSTDLNACPSTCTNQFPTDLTVVGWGYHMHGLGRQISTRIVRNGVEVPNVVKKFYDYNYQGSMQPHPMTRKIARGDTLLTRCVYDSTSRSNATRFGESTQDEMCFNFVLYYPFYSTISTCMSVAGGTFALCANSTTAGTLQSAQKAGSLGPNNPIIAQLIKDGSIVMAGSTEYTPLAPQVCSSSSTIVQAVASASASPQPSVKARNAAVSIHSWSVNAVVAGVVGILVFAML